MKDAFHVFHITEFSAFHMQIEQKEVETLEIDLKDKVASLLKLKKDLKVEQVC